MYWAKRPAKLTESFRATGWLELWVPAMDLLPEMAKDPLWEMVTATFQVKDWDLPMGRNR
jgi:hypothetical protein